MKKSAFTLVELSIVLVIIGLLVGGSFKVFKMMRNRAETTRAQDDVKVAKEAIIGNAIINSKTLPDGAFFQQNLSPVKTNQHPLLYVYDDNLTQKNICAFLATDLSVVTPTQTVDNVAFVVASEGPNHNMQTAMQDDGDGTFSIQIYKYETKVDDNTSPVNIVDYYDDVVEWVTLAQLQSRLECQREPLHFLNNSLPSTTVDESYSATLYVENNISDVTIECNSNDAKGIDFSDPSFSGTPDTSGTSQWSCTATENGTNRSVTKEYVITINTNTGGGS